MMQSFRIGSLVLIASLWLTSGTSYWGNCKAGAPHHPSDVYPLGWYLRYHLNVSHSLRVSRREILEAIKLGNLHAS